MTKARFGDILPDSLNDPQRFAKVSERHRRALSWEPQGYIPLGVIVSDPAHLAGVSYEQWLAAEVFYEAQAKLLRDTLAVGSDYMPVIAMNHLGDVLVPTMFGAGLFVPSAMGESAQETGATPRAVFNDIAEVDGLELPDMSSGHMPQFVEIITRWREWAPEWAHIVTPFPLGPFSLAMELRGSEFLVDILLEPERCKRLLSLCAEMQIRTERHLRSAIDDENGPPLSNFGVHSLGRRVGDDSIITLSPGLISEFAVPCLETIAQELGAMTLHFCTLVEHRADHVFEPLAASPWITTASTQFGFEYYEKHLERLRGRLSIEALYGDARRYITNTFGSFRDWAFDFVPRFKNESGLVLYFFDVPSVEEGRELWAIWQEAHRR